MSSWDTILDAVVKGLTFAVHLVTLTEKGWGFGDGPGGIEGRDEAMKGEMGELKGRVAAVEAENSVLREVVNDLQNRFGGPLPSRRVDGVRRRPTSATPSLIERPRGGDNHLKNP
ncbi:hypothetical protein BFJ72_g9650 [Fusarium proliferatum]|uniref:Uncharacterized protein n=1 Tax=Gibberella intermedia TaxID=948311 RepID=A0A420SY06_GIBIN|nr:hypothetical protein BFJ72_g9650 [Fusarium proliferatum]